MRSRYLAWITVGGLALRVAWTVARGEAPDGDELHYIGVAESLAAGHGFALNGVPELHVAPLYPALHALLVLVLRAPLLAGHVLSLLASAACVPAAGWLFGSAFGHRAGTLAALGVALHPRLIAGSGLVQPEGLAALTALVAAGFALRGASFASGAAAGTAFLVRPEFIALLPAVAAVSATRVPRWRAAVFVLLAGAVFVVPMVIWLHGQTGRWTVSGKDTWVYAIGVLQAERGDAAIPRADVDAELARVGSVATDIARAPVRFVRGYAARLWLLAKHAAAACSWPVLLLGAFGLGLALARERRLAFAAAAPLIVVPLLSVGMTHVRHLLPLVPVVAGFAAYACTRFSEEWRGRRAGGNRLSLPD